MAGALGAQIDLPVGSGMRIIVGAMTSTASAGEVLNRDVPRTEASWSVVSTVYALIHPAQSSAERLG